MTFEVINQAINTCVNSKSKYLNDFALKLEKHKVQKFEFKDLKISYFKTNENRRVDNPHHEIKIDNNNFLIIGEMGTGKTTCFDKIFHPFAANDDISSPIQGYLTDLKIIFNNDIEQYNFVFKTSTSDRKTKILLNENDEEKSYSLLYQIGLFSNHYLPIFFIPQNPIHDKLFDDFLPISDFSKFSEFFYNPVEIKIKNLFEKEIQDLKNKNIEVITLISQNDNLFIDYNSDIVEFKENVLIINKFIDNFDGIKQRITNFKINKDLSKKIKRRRELKRRITLLKNKVSKIQNLKKLEEKTNKPSSDLIKELYIDYKPNCPICSESISLTLFQKRYKKGTCYLCGNSNYKYIKYEKPPEATNHISTNSNQVLFYKNNLANLKKDYQILEKEIKASKEKSINKADKEIIDILSYFYIDVNRPGFSINEELLRKKNLKSNYDQLIKLRQLQIKEINNKKKYLKSELIIIEKSLNLIISFNEEFMKELKKENETIFLNFTEDIKNFWLKISGDNKKSIEFSPHERSLFVVTVSKNGKIRPTKINSIRPSKHQKRLSNSQLNALRYSIHFSLIKNLLDKYKKLPFRFVILDDPDNECRKLLMEFLDKEFLRNFDLQAIIFTTESEELSTYIEKDWKFHNFNKNEELENINSKSFQMTLDTFLQSKFNNLDINDEEI